MFKNKCHLPLRYIKLAPEVIALSDLTDTQAMADLSIWLSEDFKRAIYMKGTRTWDGPRRAAAVGSALREGLTQVQKRLASGKPSDISAFDDFFLA